MQDYTIKTDIFEGPLALLMHLIEKSQIDIYDIPIALVTEQYLAYLKAMQEFNIDIASDFLVMAATLLQIKSRMLLPRPKVIMEEEIEDPRQELVDQLLEYRKFKEAATHLQDMWLQRQKYFTREPIIFPKVVNLPQGLTVTKLVVAFAALWESQCEQYAIVSRELISVQDKMADIIHFLRRQEGSVEFRHTIFRSGSRTELVAGFLALLELIRLKRVVIHQEANFSPILISLRKDND